MAGVWQATSFYRIIPARSARHRNNALSITAQASVGTGISDLYTGLTGGALFPLLPDPSGGQVPPPIYNPNIDSGIVTYDANGNLKTIDWLSAVVGLQYYLPVGGGQVWLSLTASHLESKNILKLTPEASRGGVFISQDYADANLFFALTPEVRSRCRRKSPSRCSATSLSAAPTSRRAITATNSDSAVLLGR